MKLKIINEAGNATRGKYLNTISIINDKVEKSIDGTSLQIKKYPEGFYILPYKGRLVRWEVYLEDEDDIIRIQVKGINNSQLNVNNSKFNYEDFVNKKDDIINSFIELNKKQIITVESGILKEFLDPADVLSRREKKQNKRDIKAGKKDNKTNKETILKNFSEDVIEAFKNDEIFKNVESNKGFFKTFFDKKENCYYIEVYFPYVLGVGFRADDSDKKNLSIPKVNKVFSLAMPSGQRIKGKNENVNNFMQFLNDFYSNKNINLSFKLDNEFKFKSNKDMNKESPQDTINDNSKENSETEKQEKEVNNSTSTDNYINPENTDSSKIKATIDGQEVEGELVDKEDAEEKESDTTNKDIEVDYDADDLPVAKAIKDLKQIDFNKQVDDSSYKQAMIFLGEYHELSPEQKKKVWSDSKLLDSFTAYYENKIKKYKEENKQLGYNNAEETTTEKPNNKEKDIDSKQANTKFTNYKRALRKNPNANVNFNNFVKNMQAALANNPKGQKAIMNIISRMNLDELKPVLKNYIYKAYSSNNKAPENKEENNIQ